jgi:hypothetical protein
VNDSNKETPPEKKMWKDFQQYQQSNTIYNNHVWFCCTKCMTNKFHPHYVSRMYFEKRLTIVISATYTDVHDWKPLTSTVMSQLIHTKINLIWNDYKYPLLKKADRKYKQPYTSYTIFKANETEASIFSKNNRSFEHLNAIYVDTYNDSFHRITYCSIMASISWHWS